MAEEKRPDELILFPDAKVTVNVSGKEETVLVRPWTFGKLLDVNPYLSNIFDDLERRGTDFDQLMVTPGLSLVKNVYFSAAPNLCKIVEVTIDKDEDYVRGLDITSITYLTYIIWEQNKVNLKNVWTLFANRSQSPVGEGEELTK